MAKNGHIVIGQVGERIALGYLRNRGFQVIEQNYRKKWGEIDIVVEKDSVLHFVEVKAGFVDGYFPKEGEDSYRPEDHVTWYKKARLKKVIETYLQERKIKKEWKVDVLVVRLCRETQRGRVHVIKNVILD